jgi:hypothetical protein
MTGVAGPLLAVNRRQGVRFLFGLLLGGVLAAALLSLAVMVVGRLAGAAVSEDARRLALVTIMSCLGLADVFNRTPHLWRQVPQRLALSAPPFARGLVWGFDLGLLFTTQKVTSLTWVVLAAMTALRPDEAVVPLFAVAVASNAAIAGGAVLGARSVALLPKWDRQWQTWIRRTSGATILVLVGLIVSVPS